MGRLELAKYDLATFDNDHESKTISALPVDKSKPLVEFKRQVADEMKLDANDFRLWMLVQRENKMLRPGFPVPETRMSAFPLLFE